MRYKIVYGNTVKETVCCKPIKVSAKQLENYYANYNYVCILGGKKYGQK